MFVQGGFLEVQPHRVTVLADTAIRANDLDEVKALEAKKGPKEAMANKGSAKTSPRRKPSSRRRAWRSSRRSARSATAPG